MRTNDDIWLPEQDAWGVDRIAWEDEHILVLDDGTFVLDNDWWLNEEAGERISRNSSIGINAAPAASAE